MVKVDARLGELFGQLGISSQSISDHARRLSDQRLAKLEASYAQSIGAPKFLEAANQPGGMALFGYMPPPDEVKARVAAMVGGLFGRGDIFAPHPSIENPLELAFSRRRRRALIMNRRVEQDASFRERLGPHVGGKVIAHGRHDGGLTVQRMRSHGASTGQATPGAPYGNPYAAGTNVYDLFMMLDAAVLGQAANMGSYESGVSWLNLHDDMPGWGSSGYQGAGYNQYGMSSRRPDPLEHGGTLMDPDAALQNARRQPSTRLASPAFSAQPENPDSTSDLATMRLQRLMTKRSQMYDLYKTIYEKYNQGAKTAIDNMRA